MRQRLEPQSRWRAAWVLIVADEITSPNLKRVHPDPLGGEVNQSFRDRACNRMPHAAILAGDVLVLENDAGSRPVIFRGVRSTDQIDDLIGFDGAGARIHRIGADAGDVVDLECVDRAVLADTDTRLADVIARVNVRIEAFDPIRDKLDRAA